MLDRDRYPRLADYLDGLPEGLGSYPECESKGSLLASSLDGHDIDDLCRGLPPPLVALIREPPPAGVWVSAAMTDAVFHAVCDRHYPSEIAVLRWTYERTVSMAKHPVYRTMLRVPGPKVLMRIGAKAHGLLQRGTELELELGDSDAEIRLTFPPRLHVGLNLVANVALWRGLTEITGGEDVRCKMTSSSSTEARYALHWR